MRAIAVAAVVLHHSGLPLGGGYLGVDVFFVVSGFVITGVLKRERDATGRTRLGSFYARRFRRLIPALALVVAVTVVFSTVMLSPLGSQQRTVATGIGALALSANVVIAWTTGSYFGVAAETNPLLHTWSLSVEEQIYLVFPLILLLMWASSRRPGSRAHGGERAASLAVAALTVVSLAVTVTATLTSTTSGLVGFYSPLTRAWEFGAGALLALSPGLRITPARGPAAIGGGVGAALLAVALIAPSGATRGQLAATIAVVVATCLLVWCGGRSSGTVTRVLSTRALVGLGDRSYSVYLWHWPFIALLPLVHPGEPAMLMIAAAASIPVAFACYEWVEQPLRGEGPALRCRMPAFVTATLVPPLVVALASGWVTTERHRDPRIQEFAKALTSAAVVRGGCDTAELQLCTWGASATGRPVYLVGDSHAGHFSDGVVDAARVADSPVVATMSYNCPFVPGLVVTLDGGSRTCLDRNTRLLDHLLDREPGIVLVANADVYWTADQWQVGTGSDLLLTSSREPKHALLTDALETAVTELAAVGHDVVLVQSVPLHEGYDPERCSLSALRTGSCRHEVRTDELETMQGKTRAVVSEVARRTGIEVFDPWGDLCASGMCSTALGDAQLYRNWSHISVAGSRRLAAGLGSYLTE